jgi:hypothetical protein
MPVDVGTGARPIKLILDSLWIIIMEYMVIFIQLPEVR